VAYGVRICSFTTATGSGTVRGKTYHWDFSEMFGPLFTTTKGEPMRTQPKGGPAWEAFEAWHREYKASHAGKPAAAKPHCC